MDTLFQLKVVSEQLKKNDINKPVTELIINAVNEPVAPANKAIIPVNSRSTQNECPAASFGAKL